MKTKLLITHAYYAGKEYIDIQSYEGKSSEAKQEASDEWEQKLVRANVLTGEELERIWAHYQNTKHIQKRKSTLRA